MNSMKRTIAPVPRKRRASSTSVWSFTPRCTTQLSFSGASPARCAAAIPASTRSTGKSRPFMRRNTASSSESRLTVTRRRPASASGCGLLLEQVAVRGEREVRRAGQGGEARDQAGELRAEQRLAAGQAQLAHAQAREDAREPLDLLERQDLLAGQERVLLAVDLGRHAVRAPEVAAVGDGDAQVVQRPPQPIGRAGLREGELEERGHLSGASVAQGRRSPAREQAPAAAPLGPCRGTSGCSCSASPWRCGSPTWPSCTGACSSRHRSVTRAPISTGRARSRPATGSGTTSSTRRRCTRTSWRPSSR